MLTLHGWTKDDNSFPEDPHIILKIGTVTKFAFGDKTYFGNLVLTHAIRKQIIQTISNRGFGYVIFRPHDPANPNYPSLPAGQITYDIELTNDDPTLKSKKFTSTPTNLSLNPSPPRNPS